MSTAVIMLSVWPFFVSLCLPIAFSLFWSIHTNTHRFYTFPSPLPSPLYHISLPLSSPYTQDKIHILASDPLTSECYTLSIQENVSSMPMGEQVANILLHFKQYTDRVLKSVHTSRHHICVGGKSIILLSTFSPLLIFYRKKFIFIFVFFLSTDR